MMQTCGMLCGVSGTGLVFGKCVHELAHQVPRVIDHVAQVEGALEEPRCVTNSSQIHPLSSVLGRTVHSTLTRVTATLAMNTQVLTHVTACIFFSKKGGCAEGQVR